MAFFSIRRSLGLTLVTMLILLGWAGIGSQQIQDAPGQGQQTPPAERQVTDEVLGIQNSSPIAITDPRIEIHNISFDRRFAPNGSGEFLDVVFYIDNRTSENINLIAFVVAAWETDGVDEELRALVPYPVWRHRDYDEEDHIVHHVAITPAPIPDERIWTPDDPDYFRYTRVIQRMRSSVAGDRPIPDIHPPLWKYVEYVSNHPREGLAFTLFGDEAPPPNGTQDLTNFIPPTVEERESHIYRNVEKHTYTIEGSRRRTIFRSHHYSKFRADYKFFNRVAIVVFDADRVDAYQAQAEGTLPEGEEAIEPVIFKKVYSVNIRLRNN
ncbi:MAG: hypothetical protein H7A21_19450 [Spirochaetales bacterium]|nr:hypothetical protein [Leptospiraceae bacterium]MCP5483622.1 hypothetical protein [Spirochaetales bacterium]MCP5484513.1 hypothetical protein [Spirochaetales bacterium]